MADKVTFTTPKGTAVFPALTRPDTKFDELGSYKADIRIPAQEAQGLIKKVEGFYLAHIGKAHPKNPESGNKNALYYVERDEDGNLNGNVVFKIRVKNKINKGGELWDRKPNLFDAKGHKVELTTPVWGGSEIKVNAEVYAWSNGATKGISLQPNAVQIIKLVTGTKGGAADAATYGFGEEEGFTADEAEAGSPFSADDADEGASNNDPEDF